MGSDGTSRVPVLISELHIVEANAVAVKPNFTPSDLTARSCQDEILWFVLQVWLDPLSGDLHPERSHRERFVISEPNRIESLITTPWPPSADVSPLWPNEPRWIQQRSTGKHPPQISSGD